MSIREYEEIQDLIEFALGETSGRLSEFFMKRPNYIFEINRKKFRIELTVNDITNEQPVVPEYTLSFHFLQKQNKAFFYYSQGGEVLANESYDVRHDKRVDTVWFINEEELGLHQGMLENKWTNAFDEILESIQEASEGELDEQ